MHLLFPGLYPFAGVEKKQRESRCFYISGKHKTAGRHAYVAAGCCVEIFFQNFIFFVSLIRILLGIGSGEKVLFLLPSVLLHDLADLGGRGGDGGSGGIVVQVIDDGSHILTHIRTDVVGTGK